MIYTQKYLYGLIDFPHPTQKKHPPKPNTSEGVHSTFSYHSKPKLGNGYHAEPHGTRTPLRVRHHKHERPPLRPCPRPYAQPRQLSKRPDKHASLQPIQLRMEQPDEIHRPEWERFGGCDNRGGRERGRCDTEHDKLRRLCEL